METEVQHSKNMLCLRENGLQQYGHSWRLRTMDGAYLEVVLRGWRIQRECVENRRQDAILKAASRSRSRSFMFLASKHME